MMLPNAITHPKNNPELTMEIGIMINLFAWKAENIPIPRPAKQPIANPCIPP